MRPAQNQVLDICCPRTMTPCFREMAPLSTNMSIETTTAPNRRHGKAVNTALSVIRKAMGKALFLRGFIEGIDIRSVHRDANGEPLDEVRAIADGQVVHVSLVPGSSSSGKYLLIEHRWERDQISAVCTDMSAPVKCPTPGTTRSAISRLST